MALKELLSLSYSGDTEKIGISEERIEAVKPALRQYFAFWREYPDLFIDFLQRGRDYEKKLNFNLFFYQRVCKKPLYCVNSKEKVLNCWEVFMR